MPVYEPPRRSRTTNMLLWIGGGCLVLLLLGAVVGVGVGVFIMRTVTEAMNAPPRPRVPLSAYKFDYQGAAECAVPLPNGDRLVYMQILGTPQGHDYGTGERAVRLVSTKGKVERPLGYYSPSRLRVGVYWYPATGLDGPHVRLLDDCGETMVDLKRLVTCAILREGNGVYSGDLADPHNYQGFGYETTYVSGKPVVSNVTFDGKPAADVTLLFGKSKGVYLGSVVRSGNRLVFAPAARQGKRGKR